MNDRQLLELAAKAAGIAYVHPLGIETDPEFNEYISWTPLTDDGDALRLAVKLGLNLFLAYPCGSDKRIGTGVLIGNSLPPEYWYWHDKDPNATTRRAIVSAAAAIGEQT